jgi:SAM-dependent methyltransferase
MLVSGHETGAETMPDLNSSMHVGMLQTSRGTGQIERDGIYGMHWGDPQRHPALRWVRDHYLLPYVSPDHTAVEIGPGGGRWTRYMLGFERLYAVDYVPELLDELKRSFRAPCLTTVKNHGTDFPGIPDQSVDFLFSFGVFVHLDIEIIESYLNSMRRIIKPDGCAVIQYSDKNKEEARKAGKGFADTTPEIIRPLVIRCGHRILEEDTTTLWHSSIVRFSPLRDYVHAEPSA